jgi:hypothetical protein
MRNVWGGIRPLGQAASSYDGCEKPKAELENWQVSLAIAAVVEAIDQQQYEHHRDTGDAPFAGGFALSTSEDMSWAKDNVLGDDTRPEVAVSRPRRYWLLPLTLSALEILNKVTLKDKEPSNDWKLAGIGHTFLAVVQEERRKPTAADPRTTRFTIDTLDSSPHVYQEKAGVRLYIGESIRKIASNLQWTKQRNTGNETVKRVSFDPGLGYTTVPVPAHPRNKGGWMCVYHTVLNAWILAIGLSPNAAKPTDEFNELFYKEVFVLIQAAVAGLLDWKTLVACFLATT